MLGLEPILIAIALGQVPSERAPSVTWSAPIGCPDRVWLEERIRRYLARDVTPRLDVAGRIDVDDQGYRLQLRVDDQLRTLEGADCSRLTEAAALIIAVAADAVAVSGAILGRRDEQSSDPAPPVLPEPELTDLDDPVAADPTHASASISATNDRPRAERRELSGGIRPRVGVGGNVLPGAGVGLGAAGLLRGRGPWRVEVRGATWLPRTTRVGELDVGARLWMAGGGLAGCWEPGTGALFGIVCGGFELGALGGSGDGPDIETRRDTQLWAGATAGGGLGWSITRRLALMLEAEMLISVRRPAFHLDGFGSVHRAGAVGGRGFVGFEVRFP
jgi:hypothetical protein